MTNKVTVNINWHGLIPFLCYYGPVKMVEMTVEEVNYIQQILGKDKIEIISSTDYDSDFDYSELLEEEISVEDITVDDFEIPVLNRKK